MSHRVLPEKQWLKAEGDYVDVWHGEFDTPTGRVRRCGHQHRHPDNALSCVRALEARTFREHPYR